MEILKNFRILKNKLSFLITICSLLTFIKAQMEIISPESLKQKLNSQQNVNLNLDGQVEVAYANFGKIPLGKSLKGRLFYFKEFDGCQEDNTGLHIINTPEELSIILVKRY
jgi:hypothetical protein